MAYTPSPLDITRKLENYRNNIKILLILGLIAIILGTILDGFYADSGVWVIALLIGYLWYKKSEEFLANRIVVNFEEANKLLKYFLISWISAAVLSVILWGLELDTVLGIIIVGVATYFMNQFITDSEPMVLGPSNQKSTPIQQTFTPSVEEVQTTAPADSSKPISNFCGNCGQTLSPGLKFCSGCGQPVE